MWKLNAPQCSGKEVLTISPQVHYHCDRVTGCSYGRQISLTARKIPIA